MRKLKNDLTGQRFGRLTVIAPHDCGERKIRYICQCDCGNVKIVRSDCLIYNGTKSCGCLKKEQDKINLTANHSHKLSGTNLYKRWYGIKKRCYNVHDPRYHRYGGRGIKMCDEWKNDFKAFYDWPNENGYKEELSIDRIDNDGDYTPDNCRWISNKEQCNNRVTNINITIGNSTRTLEQWCEIFQVDYKKTYARYCREEYISIDRLFNDILDGDKK